MFRWSWLPVLLVAVVLVAGGCGGDDGPSVEVPGHEGAVKTAAVERAERRAYDGAPPVIPHENFQMECVSCHHKDDPEKRFDACGTCHVGAAAEKDAFHTKCAGCHDRTGRGPTQDACAECHLKE